MAHIAFPDNSNHLRVPYSPELNLPGDFSVVFRARTYPDIDTRLVVARGDDQVINDFIVRFYQTGGGADGIEFFGRTTTGSAAQVATTYDVDINGVWRWYAVGRDQAGGRIYFWHAADQATQPGDLDWIAVNDVAYTTSDLRSSELDLYIGLSHRFDLSHLVIYEGVGEDGLPGGDVVLQLDPENIPEDNEAESFGLTSGQTVSVRQITTPPIEFVADPPDATGDLAITGEAEDVGDATGTLPIAGRAAAVWVPPGTDRGVPAVKVEAAIGQSYYTPLDELVWTRIDDVCCVRSIETVEGRDAQVDSAEPGECKLVLDNRSGALDPSNINSPWWTDGAPGIDYGTRIRITVYESEDDLDTDTDGHVLFAGYVDRIVPRWELGDATVELQVVDALAALASRQVDEGILLADLMASPVVVGVWPLNAPGTVIAPAKGTVVGEWTAPVAVGDPVVPHDSSPAVTIGPGNQRGDIPVGAEAFDDPGWAVGVWVELDAGSVVTGDLIIALTGPGGSLTVTVDMPGGTARLNAPGDSSGGLVVVADGDPHLVRIVRGLGSFYTLYVDEDVAGVVAPSGFPLDLDTISIGSTSTAAPGRYSYLALTDADASPDDTTNWDLFNFYGWGVTPWSGDTTATRFVRVCESVGTGHMVVGTGFPDVVPATNVAGQNALEHIIRLANGDGATITVAHDNDGVPLYRIADLGAPVVWFDTRGAAGAPVMDVQPVYGIDRLVRRVEVSIPVGSDTVTAKAQSSRPYPTARVLRVDTELAHQSDAYTRALALLAEREVPRMMIPSFTLAGRDARVPWPALWLRPGDLAGIIAHPPGRAEFVQASVVQRVEHTIDYQSLEWTVRYGLDRVAQWIDWEDVVDQYDDWDDVVSTFATWGDLLASGTPDPPSSS